MSEPGVVEQLQAHRAALEARLADVGHVVAVMSGKGGVGKSTLTANVAAALADDGWAVGALDADLDGRSLARVLGVRGQRPALAVHGVRPAIGAADVAVMSMGLLAADDGAPLAWAHPGGLAADTFVWRGLAEANALREMLADTAWGRLDVLVVDLAPGTDRLETAARVLPRLDAVVAVAIPSETALQVVRRSVRGAMEQGIPVAGLVVNMAGLACGTCGALNPLFEHPSTPDEMAEDMGVALLGAVPFDPALAASADAGVPLVLTQPESATSAALRGVAEGLRDFLARADLR